MAKKRKPDLIDVRRALEGATPNPTRSPASPPTTEQMTHAEYVETEMFERSAGGAKIRLGKAFKRVARFESIDGLTVPELFALRAYRKAFDQSEVSLTKSVLDIGAGGSSGRDPYARWEDKSFARDLVRRMEARVPAGLWPTLRAVALDDKDFKAVAIERFGSREVSRLKRDRIVSTIEPRSNTHRSIIRAEFLDAARFLSITVEAKIATDATVQEVATGTVDPANGAEALDPAFFDERGIMLPWHEIAVIIVDRLFAAPDEEAGQAA